MYYYFIQNLRSVTESQTNENTKYNFYNRLNNQRTLVFKTKIYHKHIKVLVNKFNYKETNCLNKQERIFKNLIIRKVKTEN